VLKDIENRGKTDEIWCLGDIVGYGPDPHDCIETVRQYCSCCVAGNHDWAAVRKIGTVQFNIAAGDAIVWTRTQLKPEDIGFLESLPLIMEKDDFTLTHGSPRDPIWEYILSEEDAGRNLQHFKTRYCFIGHSHLPLIFECEDICNLFEPEAGEEIKLGEKRLIINPGAVGQPRDNDPRASYAIYNSQSKTVTFHRVTYDIPSVQQRMREAGLPDKLINRLAFGN
jgi:diadenosine tetraphosphatase ApaH/serine/threonine PP2A family protein phosphatase